MLTYPVDTLRAAGIDDVLLVVAPSWAAEARALFGDSLQCVEQEEPLGAAHALLQCAPLLEKAASNLVVVMGDVPLIQPSTIRSLTALHAREDGPVTLLTSTASGQEDLGRALRDAGGNVTAIVEPADFDGAPPSNETNAGIYCFEASWLWPHLRALKPGPAGEFYLTELISIAHNENHRVSPLVTNDPTETVGINDRIRLALAESALRQRIREGWMREGVTLIDPPSTFIDAGVSIGRDTVIHPNTHLSGATKVGSHCVLGPGALIRDSDVGDNCQVLLSVIEESVLEQNVRVGPYSHLRRGAHLGREVRVGNFAEIKESRLAEGVKMGHFGYVGDAQVGANANLGAGLVTCNFDGASKHATRIGEDAFIGSDTMLVAPVEVGKGAATGAGAVVTKDVPPYRLALGMPARIKERSP